MKSEFAGTIDGYCVYWTENNINYSIFFRLVPTSSFFRYMEPSTPEKVWDYSITIVPIDEEEFLKSI